MNPAIRSDLVKRGEWTRANLVEVLPDLTSPQALSAFEALLNQAQCQYLGRLLAPEPLLGPILKSFCGRLYFNVSQLRHVCSLTAVPPAEMLRSMGHPEAIHPSDEHAARPRIPDVLSALPDAARVVWRHYRASNIVRRHGQRTRNDLHTFARDPRGLSNHELWTGIASWFSRATDHMQTVLLLSGVLFHEAPVRKACKRVGFPFERLVYPQLSAGERSVSSQQAFDLMALAHVARSEPPVAQFLAASDLTEFRTALRGTVFLARFEHFLETYGHRGHYEYDWSLPRYSEDPSPLLRAIRAHLEAGLATTAADIRRRQEQESKEAWIVFGERLSRRQKWTMLPGIRKSIRRIKQYYVWREQVRSDIVRVLSRVRAWSLVLAERFVQLNWLDCRDDYFMLHLDEIAAVLNGDRPPAVLRELASERRAEAARLRAIAMPLLMRESQLSALIPTGSAGERSSEDETLTGHPVSGGCVEAEVVVVCNPGDFDRMKPGAILVAPATDPSWTPLFTLASGVIVEIGGVLSHASTIAREYGLPALANVKQATKRLRTGERVRLDAIRGVVERLDQTAARADITKTGDGPRIFLPVGNRTIRQNCSVPISFM